MMMTSAPAVRRNDVPPCFGKEWDSREPECAGGPDPNYADSSGGHVRVQCEVFTQCGTRTQQAKAASNFVPAASLVRPPLVTPPPRPTVTVPVQTQPPRTYAEALRNQQADWVERQRMQAMTAPRPPAPTPTTWQQPSPSFAGGQHLHSPASRYELNYTMPGYLTVPEERVEGEGLFAVLLREIIRGIFKAVGHVVAHAFDTRRLKEPPK